MTTPMERYLAREEHGDGMVFSITLVVRGPLVPDRLGRAWLSVLSQHPRLCGRLTGSGRRQVWTPDLAFLTKSFVWHRVPFDQTLAADPSLPTRVRPQDGCGVRCVLQSADQIDWSIQLLFHHSCCDGVGAVRIISELIKSYIALTDGKKNATRGPDPMQGKRSDPPTSPVLPIPHPHNVWATIRGRNVRIGKSLQALTNPLDAFDDEYRLDSFKGDWRLTFSESMSQKIRERLKSADITVNDWGIAVTMRALASISMDLSGPRRYLNVMNPVETRTWDERRETANHLGIAFVRRRHQDLEPFDQLLGSIAEQMNYVRATGVSKELEKVIGWAERIPGCLRAANALGFITPTAAFTCMTSLRIGKRIGVRRFNDRWWFTNVQIDGVFFSGPIHGSGQVSLALWEWDHRLVTSCRVGGIVRPSGARALLQLWANVARTT